MRHKAIALFALWAALPTVALAGDIDYSGFYLPKAYSKYMPLLKAGAPKVMTQAGCDAITYADASSKGSPAAPVFYYTCSKGGVPANIFVTLKDLKSGNTAPAKPINLIQAKQECEAYAKSRLNYPSTFDTGLFDWATYEWSNGRRRVTMDFKAKTGLGLELPAKVVCLFIPEGTNKYRLEGKIEQ